MAKIRNKLCSWNVEATIKGKGIRVIGCAATKKGAQYIARASWAKPLHPRVVPCKQSKIGCI